MVFNCTGQPGSKLLSTLSSLRDWILCYVRTYFLSMSLMTRKLRFYFIINL